MGSFGASGARGPTPVIGFVRRGGVRTRNWVRFVAGHWVRSVAIDTTPTSLEGTGALDRGPGLVGFARRMTGRTSARSSRSDRRRTRPRTQAEDPQIIGNPRRHDPASRPRAAISRDGIGSGEGIAPRGHGLGDWNRSASGVRIHASGRWVGRKLRGRNGEAIPPFRLVSQESQSRAIATASVGPLQGPRTSDGRRRGSGTTATTRAR